MFRAETVGQGIGLLQAMVTGFSVTQAGTELLNRILTGEAVAMLAAGAVLALPVVPWIKSRLKCWELLSYAACIVLFALCLIKLASGGFAPFIYAQF